MCYVLFGDSRMKIALTSFLKMNRRQFLAYFQSTKTSSTSAEDSDVTVTKYLKSATGHASSTELNLAETEILKSYQKKQVYQTNTPENVKKEVGEYALINGTQAAIRVFSKKYPSIKFNRTSVNYWKSKSKSGPNDSGFKKAGRPNMLDDVLLVKVKDIAMGTRMSGGVINRRQLINIGTGVLRANKPEMLKEFGGTIELTEGWARHVLKSMNWSKRKATTGKVEPSAQFLAEEKFTFQKAIAKAIEDNDIPASLVINLDQTPLSYVSPGKYTFHFKGSKHVPVKGVDDKRQITATFGASAEGNFLPMQVIYGGKTKRCLPTFEFPDSFSVSFTENHWSNTAKSVEFFMEIVFPYLENVKKENSLPQEQFSLVIMDTFKGQDNDVLKKLCEENYCEIVIVPHNLTSKFQPLDLTVNKPAKAFISAKYNSWFSQQVSEQLALGIEPSKIKVSSKLSDIKPLHAQWIVDLYHHMYKEKDTIINGFRSAGITEAIQCAQEIVTKVENPFRD